MFCRRLTDSTTEWQANTVILRFCTSYLVPRKYLVSIFSYHRNQYLWIIHHSRLNRRFCSPRPNFFNFVDELLEIQRSTLYNKNITRFELVQPISLKCFYKVQNLFIFLFVFLIKSICICCAVPDLPAPDPRYYVGLMIARQLFPNFLSELFWISSKHVDFKMFLFFLPFLRNHVVQLLLKYYKNSP